ncbi:MAG: glycosyltransferase [Candidatus Paceibacterota bacterium]|jgi:hypothetical protein
MSDMLQKSPKKALFCISSLGLGHATRTLPIAKIYGKTHELHVVSTGSALAFLRQELASTGAVFYDFPDYPPIERGRGLKFYLYFIFDSLRIFGVIRREHRFAFDLAKKNSFDFIISDGRYGAYVKGTPSFLISHQISFVAPAWFRPFTWISDLFNYRQFRKFDEIIIPDYEDPKFSLAGRLSHHPMLRKLKHNFVGVLSSIERVEVTEEVDYLFTLSGYLQEHKEPFLKELFAEAENLSGQKVFVLGKAEVGVITPEEKSAEITVYQNATGDLRARLFSSARFIISRAGYSTIMDLAELEKPAFLVPTPNQTEQEYLAKHHLRQDNFLFPPAKLGDLSGTSKPAIKVPWKTAESVRRVKKIVDSYFRQPFFSIIVPAHNEEKYLGDTLTHLKSLDYPKNLYEVIVVENGSTDRTLEIARRYEGENIKVWQMTGKGVSRARNFGSDKANPESDWLIFLDADTVIEKPLLLEIAKHLKANQQTNFSIGTTEVDPLGDLRLKAKIWFWIYNLGHRLTKTSFAVQIFKAKLKNQVRFDETLTLSEDLKFIKDAQAFGKFFYLPTRSVLTSTRRFDRVGWLKLFIEWNFQAIFIPEQKKQKMQYKVIR